MTSRQVVSVIINIFLVLNQTITAAELTVDTGAPKGNQAELIKAPNGVPIVNIVTPNSQGLSHNKFSNFNVEQQGLILNNAKTVANTQLAGYISYNPNLTGDAAKLILNEVTGTSKTLLRGYTEVAGQAADVIIANPNGISINGGGFINTPNATLTTGSPMMNGTLLQGFDIGGGNIVIEGDGFNAHNIARVNLYAKALELNAKLYADELSVVAGENTIALDGTVSSKNRSGSGIAIDSTLLGGIYANTITLQSTDKGIGVNLPPEVIAQNSLMLSADGDIVASKVLSNAQTTLTSHSGNINLTNDVSANNLAILAKKDLSIASNSVVQSYQNSDIMADNLYNKGELSTAGSTGTLSLHVNQILTNEGLIGGYDTNIQATTVENQGNIYSKHSLAFNAQNLTNSGTIQSDGDIDFWVNNTFSNQKNGTISSGNLLSIINEDKLTAIQKFSNEGLLNGEAIEIKAETFDNSNSVTAKDQFALTAKTLNNSGTLNSNGSMMISADTIENSGEFNALASTGTSSIAATQSINNEGLIGGYDVDVKANNLDNTGAIYSKNNLAITSKILDNSGVIRSNKNMNLFVEDSLTNQKEGVIHSDGTLSIASNTAKSKINTVTNYGLIQAENDLDITAKTLNNLAQAPVLKDISSTQTENIPQGGANNYNIVTTNIYKRVVDIPTDPAQIIASGNINLDLGTLNNAYSLIASDGNIVLNATLANNIGVVLVTTTDIITAQYRNQKKCKKKLGVIKSCSTYAAYRGTFTQSETLKESVASYGIQAKKSISGNVVTLNNISEQQGGSDNQLIQSKLSTIESIESSAKNLQQLTSELSGSNESAVALTFDQETLDEALSTIVTLDDLNNFKTELISVKDEMQEILDQNKVSLASLETLVGTLKTLNNKADTAALESMIGLVKGSIAISQSHLTDFETLYTSFSAVADVTAKKNELLTIHSDLNTVLTQNVTALQNLDISPLTSNLETLNNTLRAEVGVALSQQTTIEYKIITANEGLYQTNTHNALSQTQANYTANSSTITDTLTLPKGKYGIFLVNKAKDHPYLIEANPLYTNYNTFISSDYMLSKLDYRPEKTLKRLGDAMYETELVSNSVLRLSGSRYLEGYGSELDQFQGLMDNAILLQSSLDLQVGISLSSEQIARLNKNIVWMVEKVIDGVSVLVPEVYLASTNVGSDGAKIAAGQIDLVIQDTLLNEGLIASEGTLSVATGSKLTNQNGTLSSGSTMLLSSAGSIENLSGDIQSGGDMSIQAKEFSASALSQDKTYTYARGTQTTTQKGKASELTSGGDLSIQTQGDINFNNANVSATKDVILNSTNGNVNIASLAKEETYDFKVDGGYNKGNSTTHATSSIEGENISINANQVSITASNLSASENIIVEGKEGVNILAANDLTYQDTKVTSKSGGLLGGKQTKQDTLYKESVVQSSLNAKNILIQSSDASVNLEAANLVAKENIVVDAKADINVLTKQYREGEMHSVTKSSFGGLKQSASMNRSDALNAKEATLRTEALNIILKSGNDIKVIGSNIDAASDLQLQAANEVLIAAAQEFSQSEQWSKKSSFNLGSLLTLGFSNNPIYESEFKKDDKTAVTAKSSNINSGNNIIIDSGSAKVVGSNLSAEKTIQATTNTGSIEVLSAEETTQTESISKKTSVSLNNVFKMAESLNDIINPIPSKDQDTKIKISVAKATYDNSATSTESLTHKSSSLNSKSGDIVLDSKKDILVEGSTLEAAKTVSLTAQNGDVTIKESIDTYSENSKEKHASAEISITVQNEYVEIGSAVKAAAESAEQLKKVKDDYSKYKDEVSKLESTLSDIKARYKAKEAGIDYEDIGDLQDLIDNVKDNEKYYVAAIAAATVDLTSKTIAIYSQAATAAASSATWGFSVGLALDMKGSQLLSDAGYTKSLASSIYGNDIIIKTNTATDTTTTVSGSNVVAENDLSITTHDLHVNSSVDTSTSKQDTKDLSGSVSMTMYGGGSGLGASVGYGEGHESSDSTTNTNSNLIAKNINIETSNDASFKGATVQADDTLNVKVGGDLSVESQRDSSSSNSNGFNVSVSASLGNDKDYTSGSKAQQNTLNQTVGARTGDGLGSAGASYGASTGTSQTKQTVLTSLTGDKVNIDVENNTNIKGALIAAGETNEQGQFEDNGKLNLSTGTLTFANSTNSQYSSSNSYSVGTNIGFGFGSKTNTQTNVEETTGKVNSSSLSLSNEMGYSSSKTLATVGEGTLHVKDTENSDDLTRLNRDTTKVNKDLYSGSVGTSVTATLDHRLLTEDGRKQIKQEYEDMNIIAGTLPNANSNNPVEAAAGEVWNALTKYLSLGIVPSNENRGGILAEIPILTGTKDAAHMVLQVINQFSDKFNEKDYVKMEESNYYKSLSEEDKTFFNGKDIYVSKVPVEITPQSATYQNSINGMMNSESEAIKNGLQQTGQSGTGTPVELTIAYNPTYGFLSDVLESFVDKSGIGTTGIAKQTGQFVNEVSTARGSEGSNYALHSQANAIVYNGIAYVQTTTGFKPVGYYKANENVPTFVSFGSPMKGEDMSKVIEGSLGYTYSGSYTKPNDFVGEVLGGNSGNNEQADLVQKANILNAYKLFTSDSPHSTYVCENYADQGVQCGYRK
ncbi:hemagglutinin repeat-containing protein [Sulfurospirillum halorespirans]|uniref:Putative HecA adhesin/hemagglutinin n=1 Tax=Sulfurospirillum halorespirans DSM 13726 TaxID=1193502 RepID=A0A1D7TKS4_9BACT|nr:hemagglutinin repeat-containing protein [Sulfurospirillum halorespirans]AOO65592.1 putative HecA adhesin/hemagglutinin [Sulfurospirillum halorespirans DSM 13726]